jgi:sugar (pentulose or hexulose) kinase
MAKLLTLDLGTTYFKAALFEESGSLVASHRVPPPIDRPRPGTCTLAPGAFRDTIRAAVGELSRSIGDGLADVAALTFATQTNSFLLLDARDQPLLPILLWPDRRAEPFGNAVAQLAATPGFRATTGVPGLACEFMAAKLLWLQQHASDLYREAHRLCLIGDYLTLWLTGRHVTEAGAAGLTGAVDIHRLEWWPAICDALVASDSWLPEIARAGTDLGELRPEAADSLGLPRTCRFVLGCLDQYAGAIGAGNIAPGRVSETTGTVLATVSCADRVEADLDPEVFQGPAFDPGTYYRMVFGSTSANVLEWYRNQLPDAPPFAALDEAARGVVPGAEGLRVRTEPRLDTPRGVFVGLDRHHTTGHAARAIMEAVAFALDDQVRRLSGGRRPAEIRACGGAARSSVWLQIKADVLSVPIVAMQCSEPTSLGAAMLAARALGLGDLATLADRWVRGQPPCRPDPGQHAAYLVVRDSAAAKER